MDPVTPGFGHGMKCARLTGNRQPAHQSSPALSEARPAFLAIATLTSRWRQNLKLIPPRLGHRPRPGTESFQLSPCRLQLNSAGCQLSFLGSVPSKYRGLQTCNCCFCSAFYLAGTLPSSREK